MTCNIGKESINLLSKEINRSFENQQFAKKTEIYTACMNDFLVEYDIDISDFELDYYNKIGLRLAIYEYGMLNNRFAQNTPIYKIRNGIIEAIETEERQKSISDESGVTLTKKRQPN